MIWERPFLLLSHGNINGRNRRGWVNTMVGLMLGDDAVIALPLPLAVAVNKQIIAFLRRLQ